MLKVSGVLFFLSHILLAAQAHAISPPSGLVADSASGNGYFTVVWNENTSSRCGEFYVRLRGPVSRDEVTDCDLPLYIFRDIPVGTYEVSVSVGYEQQRSSRRGSRRNDDDDDDDDDSHETELEESDYSAPAIVEVFDRTTPLRNFRSTFAEVGSIRFTWTPQDQPYCYYHFVLVKNVETGRTYDVEVNCDSGLAVLETEEIVAGNYTATVQAEYYFTNCHLDDDGKPECQDDYTGSPRTSPITIAVLKNQPVLVKYTYDALGRLIKVDDPVNGDRNYQYDPAGNRKLVTSDEN